jgi:hypothetical protein
LLYNKRKEAQSPPPQKSHPTAIANERTIKKIIYTKTLSFVDLILIGIFIEHPMHFGLFFVESLFI